MALREYIEAQIRSLREHIDMVRESRDIAFNEAQRRIDERFLAVNRFREQMQEERAAFVRREVSEALLDRVNKLELDAANMTGRWWLIGLLASGLGAAVGVFIARMIGAH